MTRRSGLGRDVASQTRICLLPVLCVTEFAQMATQDARMRLLEPLVFID